MAFHAMNGSKVFGATDARVALPFLTFSMPWFYYKSGLFFKGGRGISGVKKDYKKLIVPFIKWGAVGYAIYLVMHSISGTLTFESATWNVLHTFYIYGYIPINTPTWFIISLFFVRIIADYLLTRPVSPIVYIIGGLTIGFVFHLVACSWLPFLIANVAMGIAFFMMGYQLHKYETRKWLFTVCLIGYVCFLLFGTSIVGHHRNVLLSGYFLLWPVFAYCGIVVFNNICRWMATLFSRFTRPITFVGENAITLLVSHALIYMPVLHFSTLSPWQTVGIIFAGYAAILIILFLFKRNKLV
jgi:hypothetical protein